MRSAYQEGAGRLLGDAARARPTAWTNADPGTGESPQDVFCPSVANEFRNNQPDRPAPARTATGGSTHDNQSDKGVRQQIR